MLLASPTTSGRTSLWRMWSGFCRSTTCSRQGFKPCYLFFFHSLSLCVVLCCVVSCLCDDHTVDCLYFVLINTLVQINKQYISIYIYTCTWYVNISWFAVTRPWEHVVVVYIGCSREHIQKERGRTKRAGRTVTLRAQPPLPPLPCSRVRPVMVSSQKPWQLQKRHSMLGLNPFKIGANTH